MKILAAAIFIFSVVLSPKIPGVNCQESEGVGQKEDSFDGFVYTVDILRTGLTVPPDKPFLYIYYTGEGPATFFETMDMDNPLLAEFIILIHDEIVYESGEQKVNVCDDSYPEGSLEANIVKIVNLEIMAGKGCPVEKCSSGYTFPAWMHGAELKFNNPIPCGEYAIIMNLDTVENKWAVQFSFAFTIKNGATECTEEKNPF